MPIEKGARLWQERDQESWPSGFQNRVGVKRLSPEELRALRGTSEAAAQRKQTPD
ncbi:MAG: hypothetical protein JOY71_14380 [Acetobacteraceae bacterium]|nr:hypothetical protein [Acetobacteraceae bacterium]